MYGHGTKSFTRDVVLTKRERIGIIIARGRRLAHGQISVGGRIELAELATVAAAAAAIVVVVLVVLVIVVLEVALQKQHSEERHQ
jgi:hypothetical protein